MAHHLTRHAHRFALIIAAFLMTCIAAMADDAATKRALNEAQLALQDAFRDNDGEKIKAMMTPDHQSMTPYYGKTLTVAEQLATLSEFQFTYNVLTEPAVSLLSDTVALITYEIAYDGTFAGKPMPDHAAISEVWVKDGGRWLQRYYQETAAQ